MKTTALFAFAALFILTGMLTASRLRTLKAENRRLEQTLLHTTWQLREITTISGARAYQSEVLQLRLNELSALYPSLVEEIKNLRIEPSRTEILTRNSYHYSTQVTAVLRDSLVRDTTVVKVFSYRDPWYSIDGVTEDTLQHIRVSVRDTLIQVVYRGERQRPWLWVFSPRKLQQRITLKNPTATVVFSEVIQVQRRRGKKP